MTNSENDNNNPLLTSDNFLFFAIKHYSNPNCYDVSGFNKDINIFNSIHVLLNKKEKNIRKITNLFITLRNIFGDIPTIRLVIAYFINERKDQVFSLCIMYYLGMIPDDYKRRIPEIGFYNLDIDYDIIKEIKKEIN